jgi:hypothetical protein
MWSRNFERGHHSGPAGQSIGENRMVDGCKKRRLFPSAILSGREVRKRNQGESITSTRLNLTAFAADAKSLVGTPAKSPPFAPSSIAFSPVHPPTRTSA